MPHDRDVILVQLLQVSDGGTRRPGNRCSIFWTVKPNIVILKGGEWMHKVAIRGTSTVNEDIQTYEFGGNSTRKVRRTNTGQVALEWTLAGNEIDRSG